MNYRMALTFGAVLLTGSFAWAMSDNALLPAKPSKKATSLSQLQLERYQNLEAARAQMPGSMNKIPAPTSAAPRNETA